MTSAQVLDLKGNKVREVGLEDSVFGVTPNVGLLHSALVRQLANGRSGAANTKTRSEVRGGGRKPWRQKGHRSRQSWFDPFAIVGRWRCHFRT